MSRTKTLRREISQCVTAESVASGESRLYNECGEAAPFSQVARCLSLAAAPVRTNLGNYSSLHILTARASTSLPTSAETGLQSPFSTGDARSNAGEEILRRGHGYHEAIMGTSPDLRQPYHSPVRGDWRTGNSRDRRVAIPSGIRENSRVIR